MYKFFIRLSFIGLAVIGLFIAIFELMVDIVLGPFKDLIYHALSDLIDNLLGLIGIHITPLYGLFCKMDNLITIIAPLVIIGLIFLFFYWIKSKIGSRF